MAIHGQVANERGLRLGSPAASPCGANCVLADPFEVALSNACRHLCCGFAPNHVLLLACTHMRGCVPKQLLLQACRHLGCCCFAPKYVLLLASCLFACVGRLWCCVRLHSLCMQGEEPLPLCTEAVKTQQIVMPESTCILLA